MAETIQFPPAAQAVPDRPLPPMRRGWRNLTSAFVRATRQFRNKVAGIDGTDSKGNITYGDLLERSIAVSRVLRRHFRRAPADNVGMLLPPAPGGALGMVAVGMAGKTAINLSYALKAEDVAAHIKTAKIRQVVTSRAFTAKMKSMAELEVEFIYLEDLRNEVTTVDKAVTGFISRMVPDFLLGLSMWLLLPGARRGENSNATVMFTSGSTGEPKGAMLTHKNILSEILSITQHVELADDEIIMGALPFFHSFGYILTWTSLTLGKTMVYYPNPLDVKTIAELIQSNGATLMASTPTLMRSYLKRATKEHFKTVRMVLLGSEKLKAELAADIKNMLGLTPVEAYGATECSPGISSCVPRMVTTPDGRKVWGVKVGSVGQPMPGVKIAIVDINTGEMVPLQNCGAENPREGLIFVHGANVMAGYLNMPAKSAEVLRNGWYCTGDIGFIDEDGFLWITDRLSQFAKVAGEMVPLIKVSNAIRGITMTNEMTVVAVAVPDTSKGERVAVIYTAEMGMQPAEVVAALKDVVPVLWLPKAADWLLVDAFPTGPTGKLDLKELKSIATARLAS